MGNSSKEDAFSLNQALESLGNRKESGKTKIEDIIAEFHEIGFAVVMFMLSMPVAIPLPYPPGSTAIFGIPLLILSIQMILGYDKVGLPKMMTKYHISNTKIIIFSLKAIKLLPKIEYYIEVFSNILKKIFSPFTYILQSIFPVNNSSLLIKIMEKIMGAISFISAICISSPIPFTHSIPAWGIAIMSLGLLRRDVFVMFLGMIVSAIGLVISYGFFIGTMKLLHWI